MDKKLKQRKVPKKEPRKPKPGDRRELKCVVFNLRLAARIIEQELDDRSYIFSRIWLAEGDALEACSDLRKVLKAHGYE